MKIAVYLFVLFVVWLTQFGIVGAAFYLHAHGKDPEGWAWGAGLWGVFVNLPVTGSILDAASK